jgi:signal transduction histidine kinase
MLLMKIYYNLFWHGFLISEAHPRKNPHLTWAGTMSWVISQRENGLSRTFAGVTMTNPMRPCDDRRQRGDRRTGTERRCGEERRIGLDRRSEEDRRCGLDRRSEKDRRSQWPAAEDQRFQGVLRTAATVSHLFSQPLTVIMGYVDLLSAQAHDVEVEKKLSIVRNQLELLKTYLQNLREIQTFRTVDFGGLTLLDITSTTVNRD